MRIGRASIDNQSRTVAHTGMVWVDITDALQGLRPPAYSIAKLVKSGQLTTAFLSPLARSSPEIAEPRAFELPLIPSKVVCLGRNYAEHARELGNEVPDAPVLFNKTPNTYLADDSVVYFDSHVGRVDHEGEIALVVGPETSVAGYTLLNDITAREMQSADKARGLPWFTAKNLDGFCPIGPAIRLADSLPVPPNLNLELRVNGELRQQGNTRQFLFDIPTTLAHISQYVTLEAGDLVATGTPSGVGPLVDGDDVTVFCEEIGVLRSKIHSKSGHSSV